MASAARTATSTAPFSCQSLGALVYINVTSVTSTPSVTFTISGVEPVGETNSHTILASAAVTATGLTVLKIYPGLTAAANAVASDIMPEKCKLVATHGNANSITYSVTVVGIN